MASMDAFDALPEPVRRAAAACNWNLPVDALCRVYRHQGPKRALYWIERTQARLDRVHRAELDKMAGRAKRRRGRAVRSYP